MAYPAMTTTLRDGLDALNRTASRLKSAVVSLANESQTVPIDRLRLVDLQRQLSEGLDRWAQVAALAGLSAYAQEQFGDPGLNVAAEYTAMRDAATALRDWINANFPRDPSTQAVLIYTMDSGGRLTSLQFTSAQLATFRTHAATFAATIS